MCAPFAYLVLAVHSLFILKLSCLSFGFFSGAFIANVFAAAYDVVPEENYGFSVGVLNLAGGLAGGAGVFLMGWIHRPGGTVELMGYNAMLAVVMAFALTVVVALHFKRHPQRAMPTPC